MELTIFVEEAPYGGYMLTGVASDDERPFDPIDAETIEEALAEAASLAAYFKTDHGYAVTIEVDSDIDSPRKNPTKIRRYYGRRVPPRKTPRYSVDPVVQAYAAYLRGLANRARYRLTSTDSDVNRAGGARRLLGITPGELAWMANPRHAGGGLASRETLWNALERIWADPHPRAVRDLFGLSVDKIYDDVVAIDERMSKR